MMLYFFEESLSCLIDLDRFDQERL